MQSDFTHTTLGKTGLRVHRLGLSASYYPGKKVIYKSMDAGINLFFGFGLDFQMTSVMRDVFKNDRSRFVLATGAYNLIWGYPNLRKSLEKRLRQFGTDYIDIFMFLGVMKGREFPERAREELYRFREEGKIGFVGMSCHDRQFAGKLASEGALDVFMIRYNAAHRGAERDIFPYVRDHNPGIISYTATRWTYLLRRPSSWPKGRKIPTAGDCYRFALSHPNVHVCLTAPRNKRQLEENINALNAGPLSQEEMDFMHDFGDAVYRSKNWFM
jgi:aryl-alcohol dehydrogenase-like predicted oxidoreductase